MTPEQVKRAGSAAETAGTLSNELSTSNILPKALCALAESCLKFASIQIRWPEAHEYVRDYQSVQWRDSLARQCAQAALLLSEGLRDMSVHNQGASSAPSLSSLIEELADSLAQATAGILICEDEIRKRLDDPRLAEIELQKRADVLKSTPRVSGEEIRRLSKEVADLQASVNRDQNTLAVRKKELIDTGRIREEMKQLNEKASAELELTNAEVNNAKSTQVKITSEIVSLQKDFEIAEERCLCVQDQLKALAKDPRGEIVQAVRRAIQELSPDGFDGMIRKPS